MLFKLQPNKNIKPFSVLLIAPRDYGSYRSSTFITENLGIGYLAAYLFANGIEVTICDARSFEMSFNAIFEKIKDTYFHLVGLSIGSRAGLFWSSNFVKLFRKKISKNVHITAGGQFPTLETKELFQEIPEINSVIMGEGEKGLLQLCRALEQNKEWKNIKGLSHKDHITSERNVIFDLNSLPFPYRYLSFDKDESYEVLLEGSRGCVFWCAFCAIRPFLGKDIVPSWRIRSAENLIEEIKYIKKKNNRLKKFRFIDSDFIGPANDARAWQFAELAIKKLDDINFHMEGRAISIIRNRDLLLKLKTAGLKRVYVGIESGSQKILDKMNKKTTVEDNKKAIDLLKELEIDFSYGFMMFTPWTVDEDVEDNLKMLCYLGKVQMNKLFHELLLIKGTKAYEEVIENTKVYRKRDSGYYSYPSLTENIRKIREIGEILEYEKIDFMQKLWFLYKWLRQLNFSSSRDIKDLESLVDNLFINIFKYLWERVKEKNNFSPFKLVDSCIAHFNESIESLYQKLHSDEAVFCEGFYEN